ncbi:MAG TPA: CAP domain-containing protein [Rubrobacter sp.]
MKYVAGMFLAAILAMVAATIVSTLSLQRADAGYATAKTCSGDTIRLTNAEERVLRLHNHARAAHGRKALCVQPDLTRAARAHSQEMLDKDYATHESYDGETVKHRLASFGYTFNGFSYYAYGENIAWGCGSKGAPDHIFHWWMQSPGHRGNILDKRYRQVGIGVRTGTFKTCNSAATYTVDFGTRRR